MIKKISGITAYFLVSVALLACQVEQTSVTPNNQDDKTATNPALLSPSSSLNYGHESALYRYLSRKWQVARINDMPVQQGVILDFNSIENKQATLTVGQGCQPIQMKFEVLDAVTGSVAVSEINRELGVCSDGFEDTMMSILADVIYLEYATNQYQGDHIILISYQDKILLTPTP